MKKFVALFMALIMCFSLFGCDSSDSNSKKTTRWSREEAEDSYDDNNDDDYYDDFYDDDYYDDDTDDDYVTTTTTKKNTNSNTGSSSTTPKNHGTHYAADGDSYILNVGDTIVLKCKEVENTNHYDTRWTVSHLFSADGAYDNSRACTLKAIKPGSGTVYLTVSVGETGKRKITQHKINFTVTGEAPTRAPSGGSSGSSSGGSYGGSYGSSYGGSDYCAHCGNTGRLDCGACIGGYITTSAMGITETRPCGVSSCQGGTRDCPYC